MTANRLIDNVGITLLDAASLIEEHGWWDGKKNPHGKLCAFMAIDMACESNPPGDGVHSPRQAAYARLQNYVGSPSIISWNDRSDAATVVAAIRDAAVT